MIDQSRHTEPTANAALGRALAGMLPAYRVRHEDTGVIVGGAGLHPDILITASDRAPVVIEAEYDPANSVEEDARVRLGLTVQDGHRRIETAIALRYADSLRYGSDLDGDVRNARFSYAVLYENGERFPASGWLEGACEDVADMVRLVSVPQSAVNEASDYLELGIETAADRLNEIAELRPNVANEIARLLGMANVHQTRRMACAILANAMVFHDRVADMHDGIRHLHMVCGPEVSDPQAATLASWREILEINYWPIFAIARDILSRMSPGDAARILRVLRETAGNVSATGANIAHDLTGRIFQRLIADRKYLATFYTLPSSAALLARLAVAKMQDVDWSDADAIGNLRVGDFACGTGALLAAVYEQFATRHENAGGKSEDLHQMMMEEALYGCDVMPSAIHISGATLSGVHPNVHFGGSRLYTLPYGRQRDGSVAIGSLELLQSSSVMTLMNTTDPALRTGSAGEETAASIVVDVPDGKFDVVIMNPPFTSNTKHYDSDGGVVYAAFAAFGAPPEDQEMMAERLNKLAKGSSYHGHAGLGSIFADLGHRKLRDGGVLALVLSFSAINGPSWKKFRRLIKADYEDLTIVSIAGVKDGMSFSADTGMAECLVVARKKSDAAVTNSRAQSVSFRSRPRDFAQSQVVATSMIGIDQVRALEDGPYGGDLMNCGDESIAEAIDLPIGEPDDGWGAGRLLDATVAQSAFAISQGQLLLPRHSDESGIPIVQLGVFGQRGHDSQLFVSPSHNGPFKKIRRSRTATYPTLWNHAAKNEKRIVCQPDWQLTVFRGKEMEAAQLWERSSRVHVNSEFTFGSQALAVAFTDDISAGGRVWPNVRFDDDRYDKPFTLWSNTSLGLLLYWWVSTRTQSSKATLKVTKLPILPTLNLPTLSNDQLVIAAQMFDEFRELDLKPAFLADADPNRALLDRLVMCDLLGFDQDVYEGVRRLAAKWCAEPSVHGGKARPKGAELVVEV